MTSFSQPKEKIVYQGPPSEFCPYCVEKGRGVAKFIPVMHDVVDIIWLCENWRKGCIYPLIAGAAVQRKHTMPREWVDPKLLGYIPLKEGEESRTKDGNGSPEGDKSSSTLGYLNPTSTPITEYQASPINRTSAYSEHGDPELFLLQPPNNSTNPVAIRLPSPLLEESLFYGLEPQIDNIFPMLAPPINADPFFNIANDDILEPSPKIAKVSDSPFAYDNMPLQPLIPVEQSSPMPNSVPLTSPMVPIPATSAVSSPSFSPAQNKQRPAFPGYGCDIDVGDGSPKPKKRVYSMLAKNMKESKK